MPQGHIAPGSDADIAILDPSLEHVISATTHHSRMDTNVYEGTRVRGKVRAAQVRACARAHVCALERVHVCMRAFVHTPTCGDGAQGAGPHTPAAPWPRTCGGAAHHVTRTLHCAHAAVYREQVVVTISRGRVVWDHGQLHCPTGSSR